MPIILEQPVIVPATQEKVFDGLFITNLMINCDTTRGMANISYCPYNTTTGEILLTENKTIFVDDFWSCVHQVPQAGTAMNAVLSAILPIEKWQKGE